MTPWYAPATLKEYTQRIVTLRSAVLFLAVTALIATEFRFSWLESAVGTYLVSTNGTRPESGAIWDQDRQSEIARQTLSQFTSQRRDIQREARRATSLGQVLEGLKDERGAMISATHFVELYLKLPPVLAHEIVSPYTVLSQLSTHKWQRTFFDRQDQRLSIYMLDDQNQVLYRLTMGPGLIEHIRQGEVSIHSGLHQLSDFAAHIYPADVFFRALNTLPEATRKGILASPEELLRVSGTITQVGISSEHMGDAVSLGFEVEDMQGSRVILTQGRREDVARLQRILDSRSAGGLSRDEVRP